MATIIPTINSLTTPNVENRETFSMIWLDTDVNILESNIVTQQNIRSFINRLKTFDDVEQCERHIRLMSEDDRVVFIVCGRLGRDIIPRIQSLRQIASIYVYCVDQKEKETWSTKDSKVKKIFANLCSPTKDKLGD
jgi:hypothetical protein